MRKWFGVAAALALAGCGQGGGNQTAAPASGLDAGSAAAHAAADKFVAMAQGSATSGNVPRATDAAAGPLLDAVFNVAAVPPSPPFSELDPINDWLGSINRVGIVYILAGTGVTDISKAPASVGPQTLRNVATYAPEMGRYYDAELAIMGAESAAVSQDLAANPDAAKDPTRADGLAKMRGGVAQMINGVLATLAETDNTADWKDARGKALAAMAPNAARLLTADVRRSLQANATQAAAATADPTLKAELNQVAATMGS